MAPIRIIICREESGWGAASPDDAWLSFVHLAPTRAELLDTLPAALEAHCGHAVAYELLNRRAGLD
ncbi:hypothetical protein U91I_02743 [alpha proteobacterium U9-1i]|nr:hypothetical protein U91I_02743 [alpha proteobacterium U9-1i]